MSFRQVLIYNSIQNIYYDILHSYATWIATEGYFLKVYYKLSPTFDTSQPPHSAVRRSRFGSGQHSTDKALYRPNLSCCGLG